MKAVEDGPQAAAWPLRLSRLAESARVLAALGALGGFALVSLARTGLDWFYGNFELTPEEVGLDQATILLQTASTGIVVVMGATLIGLVASAAATRLIERYHRAERPTSISVLIKDPTFARNAAVVALCVLVTYFAWGVATARDSLDRIRSGRSTSPQVFAHGEVIARCEEVWWKQPLLDELFASPPGSTFVFLGQSEGAASFYDPRTRRTVRVPASEIAMKSCG